MRKLETLSLTAVNGPKKLIKGQVDIPKGKKLVALLCKITFPIANTSGGALTLTAAQKRTLLDLLLFNIAYGHTGKFVPFNAATGERIHREYRFASGSELELYTDTVTGLSNEVANGATENCAVWFGIPLGKMWQLDENSRKRFGMGRTQAKTLTMEVKLTGTAIAAGLAVSLGQVTVDIYPELESCKGDRWGIVPEYLEDDRAEPTVYGPQGLPLRVSERTATHAASTLTSVTVKVDDEVVAEQLAPGDMIVPYNDKPNVPADAAVSDLETVLYQVLPGSKFKDLPTGAPMVRQDKKDLATIKLGYLFAPLYTAKELDPEWEAATGELYRGKDLKVVSAAAFDGEKLPVRLMPFAGFVLVDRDDREFEELPGISVKPGQKAQVTVPASVEQAAKARFNAHKGAKENQAAENIAKSIAAAIPGSVPSPRGFEKGSSGIFNFVRSLFS